MDTEPEVVCFREDANFIASARGDLEQVKKPNATPFHMQISAKSPRPMASNDQVDGITRNADCEKCGHQPVDQGAAYVVCPDRWFSG